MSQPIGLWFVKQIKEIQNENEFRELGLMLKEIEVRRYLQDVILAWKELLTTAPWLFQCSDDTYFHGTVLVILREREIHYREELQQLVGSVQADLARAKEIIRKVAHDYNLGD